MKIKKRLHELEDEIIRERQVAEGFKTRLNEIETLPKQLEQALDELDKVYEKLERKNHEALEDKTKIADLQREIDNLRSDVDQHRNENDTLRNELNRLKSDLSKIKGENRFLIDENDRLKNRLKQFQEMLDILEGQKRPEQAPEEVSEEYEISRYEQDTIHKPRSVEHIDTKHKEKIRKIQEIQDKKIKEQKQNILFAQDVLRKDKIEMEDFRRKMEEPRDVTDVDDQLISLKEEIKLRDTKIEDKNVIILDDKKRISQLQEMIDALRKQLETILNENDTIRHESNQLHSDTETLRHELQRVRDDNDRLRDLLQQMEQANKLAAEEHDRKLRELEDEMRQNQGNDFKDKLQDVNVSF